MADDTITDDERASALRAWDWWQRHSESGRLAKFFKWQARRLMLSEDERRILESECASKLPRIVAKWRSDKGAALDTHVFTAFKWYIHKLVANSSGGRLGIAHSAPITGKRRRSVDVETTPIPSYAWQYELAGREFAARVTESLARMDPQLAGVISLEWWCALPIAEIARVLSWRKDRVERVLRQARIQLLRELNAEQSKQLADEVIDFILRST